MNNSPLENAAAADFAELSAHAEPGAEVPLSMLLDLPLTVTVELGRTSMAVQELLQLGRGSVIRLERLAGEPVDIYVAHRRFAEGEVIVVDDHFGIRITRVLPAANNKERVA